MNFLRHGFRKLSSDRHTESIDCNCNPHCFVGGQQHRLSLEVIPPADRKHRHAFYASATSRRWWEALCFVIVCLVVCLLLFSVSVDTYFTCRDTSILSGDISMKLMVVDYVYRSITFHFTGGRL